MWQLGHLAAARDLGGGRSMADLAATLVLELRADGYVHLAEHARQHVAPPSGSEFEFGLDLILDGLTRLHGSA